MEKELEQKPKLDPKKYTVDKNGMIRPDFLFSFWILAWFLLYYFLEKVQNISRKNNPITIWIYKNMNPIFALIIGTISSIFIFIYMIIVQPDGILLLKYISMVALTKFLPIYLLQHSCIHWKQSIFSFIILFIIYLFYLYWNGETLYSVYERTITSIKSGDHKTPLFFLLKNGIYFDNVQEKNYP